MSAINRSKVYTLTAIAAALYVALTIIFGDGLWNPSNFWMKEEILSSSWLTYLLFAAIIALGVWQAQQLGDSDLPLDVTPSTGADGQVEDPKFWRLLVGNTWYSVLWLPVRFFVGQEWIAASEHKLRDDAWMKTGAALKGFFSAAVATPEAPARPKITYGWYRDFLQYLLDHESYTWLAKVVAVGELLVGLGLIVGALVGIAAFFGTLMNFNFLLAGTASTNPVLFGLGVFIVLGWKVAGHLGIDRWLLPLFGTPWHRSEYPIGDADATDPYRPVNIPRRDDTTIE